ncbi:MAG TPA: alpha/beta family hydrolase [Hyphomicrobiaceae bacterium]|nr:alpha/beta family hydrolase [Hyphomicrobiaceae bacterium]
MNEILTAGPQRAPAHVLLAHGAGAPMTSPFMAAMTGLLIERGVKVSRFEFAYMAARRRNGKRTPPPKAERLIGEYEAVVARLAARGAGPERLVIGGKSMGGRVASLIADKLHLDGLAAGLVCLGYPFHPPGKPDQVRTQHLERLVCPMLIVQGERDPFGARGEVESYRLSPAIRFHWAAGGDHDLAPRRGTRATHPENLSQAARSIASFALSL